MRIRTLLQMIGDRWIVPLGLCMFCASWFIVRGIPEQWNFAIGNLYAGLDNFNNLSARQQVGFMLWIVGIGASNAMAWAIRNPGPPNCNTGFWNFLKVVYDIREAYMQGGSQEAARTAAHSAYNTAFSVFGGSQGLLPISLDNFMDLGGQMGGGAPGGEHGGRGDSGSQDSQDPQHRHWRRR